MIRHFFGDAEHDFLLTATEIVELERTTGKGIGALFANVTKHTYHLTDIVSVVRLALVGGGTSAQEANALVRAYIGTQGHGLIEAQILAIDILTRLYIGNAKAAV